MNNLRGEWLLLLATLLAAVGWVSAKQVVAMMPISQFLGLRFLLAALLLLPFCWGSLRRVSWRTALAAFAVGAVLVLHLLLWTYAVSIADGLGEGAFIMSTAMLMAPLLAWLLFRQRPSAGFWLALPIAVSGLGLLSLNGGWRLDGSQFYFLLAALVLSLHFNLNKRIASQLPALPLVCLQLLAVGTVASVICLVTGETSNTMTDTGWAWFVVVVVFATSIRYLMQTKGQQGADVGIAALLMLLEPLWTLLLSVLMFDEPLSTAKLVGGGLILLALLLYRLAESGLLRRRLA